MTVAVFESTYISDFEELVFQVANKVSAWLPFIRRWLDNSAQKYSRIARTYYEDDDYKSAIENYRKAIFRAPENADLYSALGQVYYDDDHLSEAEAYFRMALNINAKNQRALKGIGFTLHWKGNIEEALYTYLSYLRLNPDDADVLINLGALFLDSAQYEQAIQYSEKAIKVNPEEGAAYQNLGSAYYYLGRIPEAEGAIRRALELGPNSESYQLLGLILETQGKLAEALKSYFAAVEDTPSSGEAQLDLARLLDDVGRKAEYVEHSGLAVEAYKKQGDKNGLASAYLNLGWGYYQTGDYKKSIEASRMALEINPESSTARFNLGLALLLTNDAAGAKREYLEALRHAKLSEIKTDAIDDLTRALEEKPQLAGGKEILDTLTAEYQRLEAQRSVKSTS